jgi:hypothetical protein
MAKDKPHYVNNKEFSLAVCDYVKSVNEAKDKDEVVPIIPDYIAECFLKIAEGLSYKSNFIRYTYREEMVMDAVENSLKAIMNYDIEKATRTGLPNAFAYFTQISYYAFLRRIQKEKKQQDVKFKFIEKGGYEDFFTVQDENGYEAGDEYAFVDELRSRIERVHDQDRVIKEFAKYEKKEDKSNPEGLELFFGELG